jgi:tRNA modification GTPase
MLETIACRLTAPLPAALATIALRGSEAHRLVTSCVNCHWQAVDSAGSELSRIMLVHWPLFDGKVVEQVVMCQVDRETIELHCHGGIAVSNAILEQFEQLGCRIVDQKSWRAQHGESLFPTWHWALSAIADQMLIESPSDRSLGILLDQKAGVLSNCLQAIVRHAHHRQQQAAQDLIQQLLHWKNLAAHLSTPWHVVLAGPPNVGKSSLINALSGQKRTIVHSEAGTTRDWIDVNVEIDGWAIRLTDTAGIRETSESIEQEGVVRAREQICSADMIVVVVDATIGWTDDHQAIIDLYEESTEFPKILVAWNKSDLNPSPDVHLIPGSVTVCCSAHTDIEPLLLAIANTLVPEVPPPGTPIPLSQELCRLLSDWKTRLQESHFELELNELLLPDLLNGPNETENHLRPTAPL